MGACKKVVGLEVGDVLKAQELDPNEEVKTKKGTFVEVEDYTDYTRFMEGERCKTFKVQLETGGTKLWYPVYTRLEKCHKCRAPTMKWQESGFVIDGRRRLAADILATTKHRPLPVLEKLLEDNRD